MIVISLPEPISPHTAGRARDPGGGHHKDVHVAAVISVPGSPGSPGVPGHCRRMPPTPALGTLFRRPAPSRCGIHGLLRSGPGTLLESGERAGRRGQSAGPAILRKRGKADAVDAKAAARIVLFGRADVTAKTGKGPTATMRVLRLAKESAVKARTKAKNQLKAVLLGVDPAVRKALSKLANSALINKTVGSRLRDIGGDRTAVAESEAADPASGARAAPGPASVPGHPVRAACRDRLETPAAGAGLRLGHVRGSVTGVLGEQPAVLPANQAEQPAHVVLHPTPGSMRPNRCPTRSSNDSNSLAHSPASISGSMAAGSTHPDQIGLEPPPP